MASCMVCDILDDGCLAIFPLLQDLLLRLKSLYTVYHLEEFMIPCVKDFVGNDREEMLLFLVQAMKKIP